MPEEEIRSRSPKFLEHLRRNKEKILSRGYFNKSSKQWFELWNQRRVDNFTSEKIVTPELADHSRFAVSEPGVFYGDTVCGIVPSNESCPNVYSLVSILNTLVVQWYYKKMTVPKANGFFIYKVMYLKDVPIPKLNNDTEALLIKLGKLIEFSHKASKNNCTSNLKDLIEACVMECYFRDHMVERDLRFHDSVASALSDYDPQATDADQVAYIETLNERLIEAKIPERLKRIPIESPDLLGVILKEGEV